MPWILFFACVPSGLTPIDEPATGPIGPSCSPELTVVASMDFGSVDVGAIEGRSLTLGNAGDCDLHLANLRLSEGSFSLGSLASVLVPPGQSTTLDVRFEPETWGERSVTLWVESDDAVMPEADVELTGLGIAPELHLDPWEIDMGECGLGCARDNVVTASNLGNAPLHIEVVELLSPTPELFFEGIEPLTLAPGQYVELVLEYTPDDEFSDEAWLQVDSNDPLRPRANASIAATAFSYGTAFELYQQAERKPVDIVFALDKSGSMGDNIASVTTNLDTFISALSGADADYQLAAVVQDSGCIFGSDLAITPSMGTDQAKAVWTTMTSGPAGSNTERGFSLIESATTASCNAGLVRDDATLAVVLVSDEPEQSVNPYSTYVASLQALKSDPSDVVIHAVGGDYPNGCSSAQPYTGAYEATVATGGLFLSICAADWGAKLEQLAEASLVIRDNFPLSESPVESTIEVSVNGLPVWGWTWDAAENAVVFDADAAPESGADIRIDYHLLGECD